MRKASVKRNILLCISGGIAVYKVCGLVRALIKMGMSIKVVMTESATKFVSPITFESLTGNKVYHDLWSVNGSADIEHTNLAHWAHIVVVVPATANSIGKISNGIADNFLTTVIMAIPKETKVIIVPAMNVNMWRNEILQRNITYLSTVDQYIVLKPVSGLLACGDVGAGKLSDTPQIIKVIMMNI